MPHGRLSSDFANPILGASSIISPAPKTGFAGAAAVRCNPFALCDTCLRRPYGEVDPHADRPSLEAGLPRGIAPVGAQPLGCGKE